jgi:N-terminal acetyltransferase B complex catalytic subunit
MSSIRRFQPTDLFKFNHINLDPLTETYNCGFYMQYLAVWPSLCAVIEDSNGRMMGYILGKAEGDAKLWHGHVTAVTVGPDYRRLGVARTLMNYLEDNSEKQFNAYFVDLFVRASNRLAQTMYYTLGYIIFRQVSSCNRSTNYYFDSRFSWLPCRSSNIIREKKMHMVSSTD